MLNFMSHVRATSEAPVRGACLRASYEMRSPKRATRPATNRAGQRLSGKLFVRAISRRPAAKSAALLGCVRARAAQTPAVSRS